MNTAKVIALVGAIAMGAILIYGFAVGDFLGEGSILLGMPWGQVSLVDVYVGFMLFSGWVVYRERSVVRSIIWVILIIVLGNFTASVYALIALYRSDGDWRKFWMGNRA